MQSGEQTQTHNKRAADNGARANTQSQQAWFGGERVERHSLQERGSSEPSAQSAPPSQYQWAGMQRPLEQRNSVWEHVDAAMKKKGMKLFEGHGGGNLIMLMRGWNIY